MADAHLVAGGEGQKVRGRGARRDRHQRRRIGGEPDRRGAPVGDDERGLAVGELGLEQVELGLVQPVDGQHRDGDAVGLDQQRPAGAQLGAGAMNFDERGMSERRHVGLGFCRRTVLFTAGDGGGRGEARMAEALMLCQYGAPSDFRTSVPDALPLSRTS